MNTATNNGLAFKVAGDWAAQSRDLKDRFSVLTEADLAYEPGKERVVRISAGKK